jgi:hypothetical protein
MIYEKNDELLGLEDEVMAYFKAYFDIRFERQR